MFMTLTASINGRVCTLLIRHGERENLVDAYNSVSWMLTIPFVGMWMDDWMCTPTI